MRRLPEFLECQHHIKSLRKRSYVQAVRQFERFSPGEFENVYLDPVAVHHVLNELDVVLQDSTWNNYLGMFKRLAKWLSDPEDENCPKLWRRIERKRIDWEEKLKSKWLSEEEFYKLLDVCDSLCHKALFCVAVSGALRAGELLGLTVGCVEVQGVEVRVTVSGKTGTRSFVMNQFAPVVKHWLNFHPLKHDLGAGLWVRSRLHRGGLRDGIGYNVANQALKAYAKRAGIDKAVSLHWLRHTKVTWTARNRKQRISDKQANVMFGWAPDSPMYHRYAHLHGTDTDDSFRALEGVETVERVVKGSEVLKRRKCLNCNELNAAEALYCVKCGFTLSEKIAEEEAEKRRFLDFLYKKYREETEQDSV